MTLDHPTSQSIAPDASPSSSDVSRRKFLQVGAAAGGGLMLSLSLPFANGDAEAAGADGFTPNAFAKRHWPIEIVARMTSQRSTSLLN